jgi:hypothetical protein
MGIPTLFPIVFSIVFAIVIYGQVAHSVACGLLGGPFRDCVYLVWFFAFVMVFAS